MKKSFKFIPLLAASAVVVGCNDYDFGVTQDTFKKKEYAEKFEQSYGSIAEDQDWNMASQFVAEVSLPAYINGTLKVYTNAPTVEGSELLAVTEVKNGNGSIRFDAVKGSTMFHARIEKNGRVLESGYFMVQDKKILITESAETRAEGSVPTATAYTWEAVRIKPEYVAALLATGCQSYKEMSTLLGIGPVTSNNGNYEVKENLPNLYVLNGVDYTQHDNGWTKEELAPIFNVYGSDSKTGVFKEGTDHIDQYVETGVLDPDVTFWVAEDGPVTIDIMWRGTQYNDLFGYYFYDENEVMTAEKLWNDVKKYIITDPAKKLVGSALSSLTQLREKNAMTGEWEGDWYNIDGMTSNNLFSLDDGSMIRGTKIKLVYFDKNGVASFNFPKGKKLGFFMIDTSSAWKTFFSDCALNYQLRNRTHTSHKTGTPVYDGMMLRPFAAKFNYDGRTFVGFGDESGDCDLNDIVLAVQNVNPPATDLTPDDIPEAKSVSWNIACEDMGSIGDYDFNDVVLKVTHVSGETDALVTPVAVGGTLETDVYFQTKNFRTVRLKTQVRLPS